MKAWEALKAMQEGNTVIGCNGFLWSETVISRYTLYWFVRSEPFTIKPKTSKLTAEMVVKAGRSGLKYRRISKPGLTGMWNKAMNEFRLHDTECWSTPLLQDDYDADDWVMEE